MVIKLGYGDGTIEGISLGNSEIGNGELNTPCGDSVFGKSICGSGVGIAVLGD